MPFFSKAYSFLLSLKKIRPHRSDLLSSFHSTLRPNLPCLANTALTIHVEGVETLLQKPTRSTKPRRRIHGKLSEDLSYRRTRPRCKPLSFGLHATLALYSKPQSNRDPGWERSTQRRNSKLITPGVSDYRVRGEAGYTRWVKQLSFVPFKTIANRQLTAVNSANATATVTLER